MLAQFTIPQEQGLAAEIDSSIDSAEDQERFGSDRAPDRNGWSYSVGQQGLPLSWLSLLARGVAASPNGDRDVRRSRLARGC